MDKTLEQEIRQILTETCRGEIHAATASILTLIAAARETTMPATPPGFNICSHTNFDKGFHMTFANGNTVSVRWDPGNYCDNYNNEAKADVPASATAEIAGWSAEGRWYEFPDGDSAQGHQTPEQVLAFMNLLANEKV